VNEQQIIQELPAADRSEVKQHLGKWQPPKVNLHKLPPGSIVVATGEQPRFNAFWACIIRTLRTYPQVDLKWAASVDICYNWNDAIRRRDTIGEWIWTIGDDHTWDVNIIERLWGHNREVIVPLVLKRSFPHTPVIYDVNHAQAMPAPAQAGLREVWAAGGAGMLIRESALARIPPPWFEFMSENNERAGEDLMFCRKLREAGIRIWCDLDAWMGHITPVEIWPIRNEQGQWGTQYRNVLKADVL
jgi:hypothetical protein